MRRLTLYVVMLALVACEPSQPPSGPEPSPMPTQQPQLPAAEPTELSLAQFRAAAADACAAAQASMAQAPLRGDPLQRDARRRDVAAAVRHYTVAAGAWTTAANVLFEFGVPAQAVGQSFIGALDTLALRDEQAADALRSGDHRAAQDAVAFADQAHRATDAIARDLGLGPLDSCGRPPLRRVRRRLVVEATDFAFRFEPPQRGRTRVVLRNGGAEEHHVFVVRLRRPGTLAEAIRADRRGEDPGIFLADEGEVTATVAPGERAAINVRFRPGTYGLLCFVASPDGTPHAYKGMAVETAISG